MHQEKHFHEVLHLVVTSKGRFPGAPAVRKPPPNAENVRDAHSVPGSGSSLEEGAATGCLENPIDKGVWWATVHRVAKETGNTEQVSTHAHITKLLSRTNYIWTMINSR